jgi:peptide/nickel transport system permease protein
MRWFCRTAIFCIYAAVLLAPFLSPYAPNQQNRYAPTTPPTRIHLIPTRSGLPRPAVYRHIQRPVASTVYDEDRSAPFPVRFFVQCEPYRIAGMTLNRHLFGVDEPARIFLLGSDEYGRDVFSRLLYGGRISLFLAPLATAIALSVGLFTGGVAGYFGGRLDSLIAVIADCFLSVPWVYLIFTMRASLPLDLSTGEMFFLLSLVLGLAGWARPARLVRAVVLSAKERDHVLAARGFGPSEIYLLLRHVLPRTKFLIKTQMALLIPAYLLAEATLSVFGLGFTEPTVTWGTLLAPLQRYSMLQSSWWLWFPTAFLVLTVASFHGLLHTYTKPER